MKESEMKHIASLMMKVLNNPNDSDIKLGVRKEVEELCERFPIYRD